LLPAAAQCRGKRDPGQWRRVAQRRCVIVAARPPRSPGRAMPYANVDGVLTFDAFSSLTLAILLLFTGKGLAARIGVLRRYGIPDPVVGGVLCAGVVCVLYYVAGVRVEFGLEMRDILLLYFFGALGLNS